MAVLTVGPALAALAAEGTPPALRTNRFIILLTPATSADDDMTAVAGATCGMALHVLTLGYVAVGKPGTVGGSENLLTVCSADLLTPPASAGSPVEPSLDYTLTYSVRAARKKKIEDEIALPGVVAVPTP